MLAGEKLGTTTLGRPLMESAIVELNPLPPEIVSVRGVELPGAKLAAAELDVMVKVGDATVRRNSTVRLNPPPVPITTTGHVPIAAFAAALTVMVTPAALEREELTVTDAVKVGDVVVFPEGARVTGTITEAHEKAADGPFR